MELLNDTIVIGTVLIDIEDAETIYRKKSIRTDKDKE